VTRERRARVAGAAARPRDVAGDAERFLPEAHGPIPAYEHAHRYALAASVLEGRRVLDLACGAGYGTRILRAAEPIRKLFLHPPGGREEPLFQAKCLDAIDAIEGQKARPFFEEMLGKATSETVANRLKNLLNK